MSLHAAMAEEAVTEAEERSAELADEVLRDGIAYGLRPSTSASLRSRSSSSTARASGDVAAQPDQSSLSCKRQMPVATPRDVWFLGVMSLICLAVTGHLAFRTYGPSGFAGDVWRKGCRQCHVQWWEEFWSWRHEGAALDGEDLSLVHRTPPPGMEWEWAHAESSTDWWNASRDLLHSVIEQRVDASDGPLLQIGCGDSPLPGLLHSAGFRDVDHIDISPQVVSLMRRRYSGPSWEGMRFEVRDFMASPSAGGGAPPPAHKFSAVIDKAGIWDWLQDEAPSALRRLLAAVQRALKTEGVYIVVTKQPPSELQQSLTQTAASFIVEESHLLQGGQAWAYVFAVV